MSVLQNANLKENFVVKLKEAQDVEDDADGEAWLVR